MKTYTEEELNNILMYLENGSDSVSQKIALNKKLEEKVRIPSKLDIMIQHHNRLFNDVNENEFKKIIKEKESRSLDLFSSSVTLGALGLGAYGVYKYGTRPMGYGEMISNTINMYPALTSVGATVAGKAIGSLVPGANLIGAAGSLLLPK